MSRAAAPPELLARFDSPAGLAADARAGSWPMSGMRVMREAIEGLELDGGVVSDTDFHVETVGGARWRNVVIRGCRLECGEVHGLEAEGVRFEDCTFVGGRVVGGSVRQTAFSNCTLSGTLFDGTVLDGVRVDHGMLEGITLANAQARHVQLDGVTVRGFAGFDAVIEDLVVRVGQLERVRIGGGQWRLVRVSDTEISGVEVAQAALAAIQLTGGTILNCSQSEGTLESLTIEAPTRLLGLSLSAVTLSKVLLASITDGAAIAILRSALRGLTVLDSALLDTELRDSRIDAPARVERARMDGLDLRGAVVAELAMQGSRLAGPVRVDRAQIRRWTLADTTLANDLMITGAGATIAESDPRISSRG